MVESVDEARTPVSFRRIQQRTVRPVADTPVPQAVEEVGDVFQVPFDRAQQRDVGQIIEDVPSDRIQQPTSRGRVAARGRHDLMVSRCSPVLAANGLQGGSVYFWNIHTRHTQREPRDEEDEEEEER